MQKPYILIYIFPIFAITTFNSEKKRIIVHTLRHAFYITIIALTLNGYIILII